MTTCRVFLLNARIDEFDEGRVRGKRRLWPPTALAILASLLRDRGHTVELVDATVLDLPDAAIHARVADFAPDVVVFSSGAFDSWQCPSPGIDPIVTFAQELDRDTRPRPHLVVSGPHGTLLPGGVLREAPGVDFVVRGEPECATAALVDALARGADGSDVPGVSRRTPDGRIEHAPDAPRIEDLDALPLPAFDLLPLDLYRDGTAMEERFFVTATSRGCTLQCSFCNKSMFGDTTRNRSIANVLAELEVAVRTHGITRVLFHDQNFVAQPRRVRSFCEQLIERDLPLNWRCQSTLFRGDAELLALMARAGCTEIHIGLESGSPAVLERLRKGGLADFQRLVERADAAGIRVLPNNLIGLPGDSYSTVLESMDFFHANGFDFRPWVAIPYPGTPLYRAGVAEGSVREGDWQSVVAAAGLVDNDLDEKALRRIFRRADARVLRRRLLRIRPRTIARRLLPGAVQASLGL